MAFPTVDVTPGTGQTVNTLPNAGQATMAESLPVAVASNQSAIPVSAAALPLPAGAATETTLAAAAASLSVLDDFDESDRCKVNLIAGQAGVQGGSGAVSALTQRVVLATDIALPAGENVLGHTTGIIVVASANFTRPADTTAYAVGDLAANSTTAGSVTPMSLTVTRLAAGNAFVRRARLRKSTTSLTNASFRVHLYGTTPTVTNGDNGAWLSTVSGYLGSIDVTIDKAFSDAAEGVGAPNVGGEINLVLSSGQAISALLEVRGAYTPGNAEVFTLELEVWQN